MCMHEQSASNLSIEKVRNTSWFMWMHEQRTSNFIVGDQMLDLPEVGLSSVTQYECTESQ